MIRVIDDSGVRGEVFLFGAFLGGWIMGVRGSRRWGRLGGVGLRFLRFYDKIEV